MKKQKNSCDNQTFDDLLKRKSEQTGMKRLGEIHGDELMGKLHRLFGDDIEKCFIKIECRVCGKLKYYHDFPENYAYNLVQKNMRSCGEYKGIACNCCRSIKWENAKNTNQSS